MLFQRILLPSRILVGMRPLLSVVCIVTISNITNRLKAFTLSFPSLNTGHIGIVGAQQRPHGPPLPQHQKAFL